MPKWWPLLAALLLLTAGERIVASHPPVTHEDKRLAENQAQKSCPDAGAERGRSTTALPCCPSAAPANHQQPQSWKDWVWPPSWSNWAIFAVTAAYALVAYFQWLAIAEQAHVGGDAAKAAKRSADTADRAVSSLERPWLIVRVTKHNVKDALYQARGEDTRAYPVEVAVSYELANYGRTPAWIVKSSMPQMYLMDWKLRGDPPYRYEGEREHERTPLPEGVPITGDLKYPVSREQLEEFLSGRRALVFFGAIFYRDVFTLNDKGDIGVHATRFCLVSRRSVLSDGTIFVSAFSGDGPASWTEYT